jgi:hypothetical protein
MLQKKFTKFRYIFHFVFLKIIFSQKICTASVTKFREILVQKFFSLGRPVRHLGFTHNSGHLLGVGRRYNNRGGGGGS